MHILIAPNAFKNGLTAQNAADAIQTGISKSQSRFTSECFPICDGGDGTGELLIQRCNGTIVRLSVQDPLGRRIQSSYGLIDNGNTAIIEMADASGLRLLQPDELDPLRATTFGTGEMIRSALDKGVNKILVCMGGSATVDGGCGILRSLGVRFLDKDAVELTCLPLQLNDLSDVDVTGLDKRVLSCDISILCDVDNRLLGEKGSAAMFGPQKGATKDDVKELEAALKKFSEVIFDKFGKNMADLQYGGTAGGAAAGLQAFLNAKLESGIDLYLKLTGFDVALLRSDIIITGEGCIDEQTLQGKAPFGVATIAKSQNKPVIGLAGKIPLVSNVELEKYFDVLLAIGNEPVDLLNAIKNTQSNLIRTGSTLGKMLSMSQSLNINVN